VLDGAQGGGAHGVLTVSRVFRYCFWVALSRS
jgi:hypothetical protein